MTGYLPVASVASLSAADTPSEQLPSDALLQTQHRLRLAVLQSIWAASHIAQASRPIQPSDASEPDAVLASSLLPNKHDQSTYFTSSAQAAAASHSHIAGETEDRLKLQLYLSSTCPVLLC